MNLEDSEIPQSDRKAGTESLPEITKRNRGLYLLIISILGTTLVVLVIGWLVLAALGKAVPEEVPVVVASIVGGLVGAATGDKSAQ